ncbi:MAG: LysR family transcriptional regulator [Telluria sp.]
MARFTLSQLMCFEAVAATGNFQAAAERVARTQPAVFAAVKNLESQLGLTLLDRNGYRIGLTEHGHSLRARLHGLLREASALEALADELATGREATIRIVVGDLCPVGPIAEWLGTMTNVWASTELQLSSATLSAPWERLRGEAADLVLHHADHTDLAFEYLPLGTLPVVPVAAPALLARCDGPRPEALRGELQCVLRDEANAPVRNYYLLDGARRCVVDHQELKRSLIVAGLCWGHMPLHLVQDDLAAGRLADLRGEALRGGQVQMVAARRAGVSHGPVAQALWDSLRTQALDGLLWRRA